MIVFRFERRDTSRMTPTNPKIVERYKQMLAARAEEAGAGVLLQLGAAFSGECLSHVRHVFADRGGRSAQRDGRETAVMESSQGLAARGARR